MNNSREYKQPVFGILVSVFMLLFVGVIIFFALDNFNINALWFFIPLVGLFGIVFLIALISFTSKIVITDDEITSQILFIPKVLKWTEINRVSGSGNSIKLHNEDTTISINPRLPGYEEIIDIIGQKRADLFTTLEYSEMRRGIGSYLSFFLVGLIFVGMMITFFLIADFSSNSFFSAAVVAFFLLIFLVSFLTSPQSLTLENNNLQIKYLFGEKNFLASEIVNFYLAHTRTRKGGKQYFISLVPREGKYIRISGLNIGLPVAYLVLKNWHKKYVN